MFTIINSVGEIKNLRVGIAGHLATRTKKSMLKMLTIFKPKQLFIYPYDTDKAVVAELLDASSIKFNFCNSMNELLNNIDVLDISTYFQPNFNLQKSQADSIIKTLPEQLFLNEEIINKRKIKMMCPGPLFEGIGDSLKYNKLCLYYRQISNNILIKIALIEFLIGENRLGE